MELILRFLNKRIFFIVAGLIAAVVLADRFQMYPRLWYEHWRYPAQGAGNAGASEDIRADLDHQESLRLHALHREVSLEIAAAAAKGFDVARLQAIADSALNLDTPAYRSAAMERLNKLRLAIPQKAEIARPADSQDEAAEDRLPTPKPRAVGPARRRRRR
jgi:hypothetical protein